MGNDPISLSPSNPFGYRATAKHAIGDLLNLGGIAAAQLKFERARDNISLSKSGAIHDKTVVSEVTTVSIRALRAYKVDTESAADAAHDKSSGKALASATRPDGDINVVKADDANRSSNIGWVSVDTKVTYSDGSTEVSSASLNSTFMTTGDGLARNRLDAIVGGASSEAAILKKLGIAEPDTAAADAANASTGVGVHAKVSSNFDVSLTYVAQGDQRTIRGLESGNADALITTFDPKQLAYGSDGILSTTKESMSFAGVVSGGSLSSDPAATWLSGSTAESTKSVTTIPGENEITIARESTANAEFATTPTFSYFAAQTTNATQTSFARVVGAGTGGTGASEREQITLSTTDSSAQSQAQATDNFASSNSTQNHSENVSLSWTPTPLAPTLALSIQPIS